MTSLSRPAPPIAVRTVDTAVLVGSRPVQPQAENPSLSSKAKPSAVHVLRRHFCQVILVLVSAGCASMAWSSLARSHAEWHKIRLLPHEAMRISSSDTEIMPKAIRNPGSCACIRSGCFRCCEFRTAQAHTELAAPAHVPSPWAHV